MRCEGVVPSPRLPVRGDGVTQTHHRGMQVWLPLLLPMQERGPRPRQLCLLRGMGREAGGRGCRCVRWPGAVHALSQPSPNLAAGAHTRMTVNCTPAQ
jgi:hypothetical protein